MRNPRDSAGSWPSSPRVSEPETAGFGPGRRRGPCLSLLPSWAVRFRYGLAYRELELECSRCTGRNGKSPGEVRPPERRPPIISAADRPGADAIPCLRSSPALPRGPSRRAQDARRSSRHRAGNTSPPRPDDLTTASTKPLPASAETLVMSLRLGECDQTHEPADRCKVGRVEDLGVGDAGCAVTPFAKWPLLAALDEALAQEVGLNGPRSVPKLDRLPSATIPRP